MLLWLDRCDSGSWGYQLQAFTAWVHCDFGNVYVPQYGLEWFRVIVGSKIQDSSLKDWAWTNLAGFGIILVGIKMGIVQHYLHKLHFTMLLFFNSTKVCSIRGHCLWALPHLEMGAVLLKMFDDIVVVPRVDHLMMTRMTIIVMVLIVMMMLRKTMMIYRVSQNKVFNCIIHL